MADNERVEYDLSDVPYQQLVQTGRTEFTPGKKSSKTDDENWPKEFSQPEFKMVHNRVVKLGRNVVCDTTVDPISGACGTLIQDNNGTNERSSGYERKA